MSRPGGAPSGVGAGGRRRRHAAEAVRPYGTAPEQAAEAFTPGGAEAAQPGASRAAARSLVHHASRAGPGLEDMVSAEGFVPRAFVSSRSKRAAPERAAAADFMDAGERAALAEGAGRPLRCAAAYDAAAEPMGAPQRGAGRLARAQDAFAGVVAAEAAAILGGGVPSGSGLAGSARKGAELLRRLGWREGGGIGVRTVRLRGAAEAAHGSRATVLTGGEDVPLYTPPPRLRRSRRGMGYGGAERAPQQQQRSENGVARLSDTIAAREQALGLVGVHEVVDDAEGDEDDIYDDGGGSTGRPRLFTSTLSERSASREAVPPALLARLGRGGTAEGRSEAASTLALFAARPKETPQLADEVRLVAALEVAHARVARLADVLDETHLEAPPDFAGRHVFRAAKGAAAAAGHAAPPPAPPPRSGEVRRAADTLAAFVARNGVEFEAIAAERSAADPAFAFLRGGEGAAYYRHRKHLAALTLREQEGRAAAAAALGSIDGGGGGASSAAATLAQREAIMRDDGALRPAAAQAQSVGAMPQPALSPQPAQAATQPQPPAAAVVSTLAGRFGPAGAAAAPAAPAAPQRGRSTTPWEPARLLCKRFGVPPPKGGDGRANPERGDASRTRQLLSGDGWMPAGEATGGGGGLSFASAGVEQQSFTAAAVQQPPGPPPGPPPPVAQPAQPLDEVDAFLLEAIFNDVV